MLRLHKYLMFSNEVTLPRQSRKKKRKMNGGKITERAKYQIKSSPARGEGRVPVILT
jgi:hypothetical protein